MMPNWGRRTAELTDTELEEVRLWIVRDMSERSARCGGDYNSRLTATLANIDMSRMLGTVQYEQATREQVQARARVHRDGIADIQGTEANREFIAAANPAVVLGLIPELEEQRNALASYAELATRLAKERDAAHAELAREGSRYDWRD